MSNVKKLQANYEISSKVMDIMNQILWEKCFSSVTIAFTIYLTMLSGDRSYSKLSFIINEKGRNVPASSECIEFTMHLKWLCKTINFSFVNTKICFFKGQKGDFVRIILVIFSFSANRTFSTYYSFCTITNYEGFPRMPAPTSSEGSWSGSLVWLRNMMKTISHGPPSAPRF